MSSIVYDGLKPKIPSLPGCYLFKDGAGKILYVGKAKDLKKRVSSYFLGRDQSPKTQVLVSKIVDAEFIVTDNEVEALVLENNLIKQHQPPYNIDLKSNVRYAYIALTDEKWPRVLTVRKKPPRGKTWGPYTDGYLRVQLIKLCIDVCKLRICRTLPKRPCLQYHLGKCDAPCIANVTHEEYMRGVMRAKRILDGKADDVAAELQTEMTRFAKNQEYEKAKERRDQLALFEELERYQKVETRRAYDQDVIATMTTGTLVSGAQMRISLFQIKRGVIMKRERYTIDAASGQPLSEFLRAYYATREPPKEIVLDALPEDESALTAYFTQRSGKDVILTVPDRGEKKALLDLARQNAAVDFQEEHPALAELARVLKLKALPRDIECFDISHLMGEDVVAASVHYRDGEPLPSEFRRYDIKTVDGQDDFRSMQEAVGRRYARLKAEGAALPDLLVIDGGREQLRFARKALAEVGVAVPSIALAKKEEEVYYNPNLPPLRLPRTNPALKLLQRIRDSTHRFVLGFQKVKRGKRMLR